MTQPMPTAPSVREWAWTLEGKPNQVDVAWRAAHRCVSVWEEISREELSWLDDDRAAHVIAEPRRLLWSGPLAADLSSSFRELLSVQCVLGLRIKEVRRFESSDGLEQLGLYVVRRPPYRLYYPATDRTVYALSSTVHALAAMLWSPEWVSGIEDEAEYEAQVAAGPIRATVESCVSSAIAKPDATLQQFIAEVGGGS